MTQSSGLLLDEFQTAIRLKVELDMTPRWRWRKRERLTMTLTVACENADRIREAMGANPNAVPLIEQLDGYERNTE